MGVQVYCVTLTVLLLAGASDSFAANDATLVGPSGSTAPLSSEVQASPPTARKTAAEKTASTTNNRGPANKRSARSIQSSSVVADARRISPATPILVATGETKDPQNVRDAGELATIVVTAQKRSQNSQRVPITITAFDSQELNTFQITTVGDLAQAVPGFELINSTGGTYPVVRGLGVMSQGAWQESPVSTYIDGVYYASTFISDAILNNIAEVEVDKGPQGTLFGRNAVGGLVSYRTIDPSQKAHTDVSVGYGTYQTETFNLYTTGGITPDLAANLAVAGDNQNQGWGRNLYTGGEAHTSNDYSARTKWLWTPGENTTVTWVGNYGRSANPGAGIGLDRGEFPFITTGPSHVGGFNDIYTPLVPHTNFIDYGMSLKVEHNFKWAQFASISAWNRDWVLKNTPYAFNVPFLPETPAVGQLAGNKIDGTQKQFDTTETQELQMLSPDMSTIKWVAGVFLLFDNTGNVLNYSDVTSPPLSSLNTNVIDSQETHSYSAYAQTTAPISNHTRITGGVRYTSDHRAIYGGAEKNTVANQNVYTFQPSLSAAANPEPSFTAGKTTYKAVLEQDVANSALAYFSFSTGFQSGYYSLSGNAKTPPLLPETIIDYEVGAKTQFLDNRLRLNASLFLYNLNNLVVSNLTNGVNVQNNAATARAKGVDVDFNLRPIQSLLLGISVEYIDPVYTKYQDSIAYVPNASGEFNTVTADAAGRELQYTEKFMGAANAAYSIDITDLGSVTLFGEVTYHSGLHYDTQDLSVQAPYALVNSSVSWAAPSARWDVKVWAKNLTNRKYVGAFVVSNVAMMYNPAPPLTGGIQFDYHF